jgi:hypothetical protein
MLVLLMRRFMKYVAKTASDVMTYLPSIMNIGSEIQVMLKLLHQQFERLQCWYCHVSQWLSRGFGLVNRFIGSSLVVTTISSYTLNTTATIAHKDFNVF